MIHRHALGGSFDRGGGSGSAPLLEFRPSVSPLWLLTDEPQVNELVGYLETMRRRITANPRGTHTFLPLFGFYRDLLKWLFLAPAGPPPAFDSVEIVVTD